LEFRFRILTLLSSGIVSVKEKVLFAATRFPHFDAFVCVKKLAAVRTELYEARAAGSRCDSRSLATPSKYYTFKKFWFTLVRGKRLNYKEMLIKRSTWPCLEIRMKDEVAIQILTVTLKGWKSSSNNLNKSKFYHHQTHYRPEVPRVFQEGSQIT